jgi:hypothetical protein
MAAASKAREMRDLVRAIRLATLELRLDAFVRALEQHYRPDQPRAPAGTPIGGQWVKDPSGRAMPPARTNVALAGKLLVERVGIGDTGLIRQCIYIDMFGRQYGFEQDAAESCPRTYRAAPYYGPL